MPQMANVTIKKADGTTDVVYTALTPSAGDNVPARWRANSEQDVVAYRPSALMLTRDNQKGNGRAETLRFKYPVVREVNGASVVIGTVPMEIHTTVGQQFTQTEINEAISQGLNFAGAALIRDSFKDGFAPT